MSGLDKIKMRSSFYNENTWLLKAACFGTRRILLRKGLPDGCINLKPAVFTVVSSQIKCVMGRSENIFTSAIPHLTMKFSTEMVTTLRESKII
jgi:hypothetical protein